jgi:hypothetical protein
MNNSNNWKPITESPTKGGSYLICQDDYQSEEEALELYSAISLSSYGVSKITVGNYDPVTDSWSYLQPFSETYGNENNITHWMPLPSLPEEEQ